MVNQKDVVGGKLVQLSPLNISWKSSPPQLLFSSLLAVILIMKLFLLCCYSSAIQDALSLHSNCIEDAAGNKMALWEGEVEAVCFRSGRKRPAQ